MGDDTVCQLDHEERSVVEEPDPQLRERRPLRSNLVQVTLSGHHFKNIGTGEDERRPFTKGRCKGKLGNMPGAEDHGEHQSDDTNKHRKKTRKVKNSSQITVDIIGSSDETEHMSTAEADPPAAEMRHSRRFFQSTLMPHHANDNGDELERKLEINGSQGNSDKIDTEEVDRRRCRGNRRAKTRSPYGVEHISPSSKTTRYRMSKKLREGRTTATPTENETVKNLKGRLLKDKPCQVLPDLRLEAKTTAEENSRIFAGREIHPFFSSLKSGDKWHDSFPFSSNCARENDAIPALAPIHVFERLQDDSSSFDWTKWEFYEPQSTCIGSHIRKNLLISLEDLHGSQDLNVLQNLYFNGGLFDASRGNLQCLMTNRTVYASADVSEGTLNEEFFCYLSEKNTDCRVEDAAPFNDVVTSLSNINVEVSGRLMPGRLASYCVDCPVSIDSLWANKYLPRRVSEVCGNGESVSILNEWLGLWHERHLLVESSCSDSDSEGSNVTTKNVLLVTGPVGCGKSAAIYACAKEQGFHVLELNTSECRSGSMVKMRIGEALESRSLRRSLDNPAAFRRPTENVSGIKKDSADVTDTDKNGRTLILFEDVDVTFLEDQDRGFLSAIQQLAEAAKQPIVLTSNCTNPTLPDGLQALHLSFMLPSQSELLDHLSMVCAAEKVCAEPQLIEKLIKRCRGDMRRALMHIQFWFQHLKMTEESTVDRRQALLSEFDLSRMHEMMTFSGSEYPSQLSEAVEMEISKALNPEEASAGMGMRQDCEFVELITETTRDERYMGDDESPVIGARKHGRKLRLLPSSSSDDEIWDAPAEVETLEGGVVAATDVEQWVMSMDECSDDDSVCATAAAWKKLRSSHDRLGDLVTVDERSRIQEGLCISHELTSLISETDVMLRNCRMAMEDVVLPAAMPPADTDELDVGECLRMATSITNRALSFYGRQPPLQLCNPRLPCAAGREAARSVLPNEGLQSMVDGVARHEIISSLCCMSASEAARLSRPQSGRRRSRHYFTGIGLSLSPALHLRF